MEKEIPVPVAGYSHRIVSALADKCRFNIMVVGESGLGKTTFLHKLLRRYGNVPISPAKRIEKTITISEVGRFDASDDLDVRLYDAKGHGDDIDNQNAIDEIKEKLMQDHEIYRNLDCPMKERLASDNRIHVVFYFISSHRMKDIDSMFIAQLSPIVPIIPVIAKADTMTVEERNNYILEVHDRLTLIGPDCTYNFGIDGQPCEVTTTIVPLEQRMIQVGRSLLQVTSPEAEDHPTDVDSTEISASEQEQVEEEEDIEGNEEQRANETVSGGASLSPMESSAEVHTAQSPQHFHSDDGPIRLSSIFAVICDLSDRRVYPWGTLEINDMSHSDFRRLQILLFENGKHMKRLRDDVEVKTWKLFPHPHTAIPLRLRLLSLLGKKAKASKASKKGMPTALVAIFGRVIASTVLWLLLVVVLEQSFGVEYSVCGRNSGNSIVGNQRSCISIVGLLSQLTRGD